MLQFTDHRLDPAAWASALDISREAIEIYLASEVVDLHIDAFIWTRAFGYDLKRRHGTGLFGARIYSQTDLPRLREARISGGIWSITTNPLRRQRANAFYRNFEELQAILATVPEDVVIARTAAEYYKARSTDKHVVFIGIQGGNALDEDGAFDRLPELGVVKVTVLHLTNSKLGTTSSPLKLRGTANVGLTALGRDFIKRLNERRVFVDLAHISKQGFADAVEVHDKTQPLLVSHTGVSGVHEHWRNLDDGQIRSVANTGGVVGVMYQASFLGPGAIGRRAQAIADHIDHIVNVAGEDCPSLGSDWDGAITPPRDLQTPLELPRLVELMLKKGYKAERIAKILGGNFLRSLAALRG